MLFCMKKEQVDAAENVEEAADGTRNARGISGYVYDVGFALALDNFIPAV